MKSCTHFSRNPRTDVPRQTLLYQSQTLGNDMIIAKYVLAAVLLTRCALAANVTCYGDCNCNTTAGASSGTIAVRDYRQEATCEWLIASGTRIDITITLIDTQVGSDFLTIDACKSASCGTRQRLVQLSGRPQILSTYTAWTGYAKVVFTSDALVSGKGFELKWSTRPHICGNGQQEVGEECEDGNTVRALFRTCVPMTSPSYA